MFRIILLEPENPGNIGAIARVMKNFGLKELILINPKTEINEDSRKRAKHAQDILDNIKLINTSFSEVKKLLRSNLLIGTTGKLGGNNNLLRNFIPLRRLSSYLKNNINETILFNDLKIDLLFGRESFGLLNNELKECDLVTTIPSNKEYPIFNLSHAVAIVIYELTNDIFLYEFENAFPLPDINRKKAFFDLFNKKINNYFSNEEKEAQLIVWKKIISLLNARELQIIFGFLRKISFDKKK